MCISFESKRDPMSQTIKHVTVKGLVCQDEKVLMLKDSKNNWELPGGRLKSGEHPHEALKREFYEELGVQSTEIGKLIDTWNFSTTVQNNTHYFNVVVFECHADLSKITLSDEHVEWKWIKMSDINRYSIRQGYRESINRFWKGI